VRDSQAFWFHAAHRTQPFKAPLIRFTNGRSLSIITVMKPAGWAEIPGPLPEKR